MKIAVPFDHNHQFYRANPYTSPGFGIYQVDVGPKNVTFSLTEVIDNPWFRLRADSFDEAQLTCQCEPLRRTNLHHVIEHYTLLESLDDCEYLLANCCCYNTRRTLAKGNVILYEIPSIIIETNMAIKHFIIGTSLAKSVQEIA